MKIFGNDGFRSKFGTKYMSEEFLNSFAIAVSHYYIESNFKFPIIIGRDTRSTGEIIESIISNVFSKAGIDTILVGIISTPALSFLIRNEEVSLGIMITASHNPASDNGIKLFANDGFKLDEESEMAIEKKIKNSDIKPIEKPFGNKFNKENLVIEYSKQFQETLPNNSYGFRYLIDCSNGSISQISKVIFENVDYVDLIFNEPNGNNVNLDCGALEPQKLHVLVKNGRYDFGIAFDGDGDRVVFVDKNYGLIEAEKLIVLFAKIMLDRTNYEKKIVCTEICNKGLEENLERIGVDLILTELGDRLVVNCTVANNALLGAETSGHYFFPYKGCTMDGMMALFHFLELNNIYGNELIKTINSLRHYNRISKNIKIEDNFNLDLIEIKKVISIFLNKDEKFVIRRSMWDSVVRIYYDYTRKNRFDLIEDIVIKMIS